MRHICQNLATFVLAGSIAHPAPAQRAATPAETTELKRITQQLFDAVAPGEKAVWDKYLDAGITRMDENGNIQTKADLLKELEPLPKGLVGSIKVDKFEARRFGDFAVAAVEMQEELDYFGQKLHTRFRSFDTWRSTRSGWKLVGQHIAAVLKDPPALPLRPEALCAYNGRYRLTAEIETEIKCAGQSLESKRTNRPKPATYLPEVTDMFFQPGQPRSRRVFTRDVNGRIDGFVDRREGEDIRWTKLN